MAGMDEAHLSPEKAFSQTLVFFTYRKILRQHGGSFNSSRSNGFALGLFILWLISFGIYSATWDNGVLSIQFKPAESDSSQSKTKFIVGGVVYILNFVLVLIAIFWNVGSIVLWFFAVVLVTTIIDLIMQGVMNDKEDQRFALAVLHYTATSILGLIVLTCFWNFDFVPAFTRWRFGKRTRASFPYWTFIKLSLLLFIMIPIWIPELMALAVIILASFLGLPTEIFFPFDILFRLEASYWRMTVVECHYEFNDILGVGPFIRTRVQYERDRRGSFGFSRLKCLQAQPACFSYEGACTVDDHVPHGNGTCAQPCHQ